MILPLGLLLAPSIGVAQQAADTTITVRGHVVDTEAGVPVPGMRIIVEGLGRSALSDSAGTFVLADIPRGVYTVRGTRIGYAPAEQRDVPLRSDAVLTLATVPQAIVLEGVSAEVNARVPEMIAQLEERRRTVGWGSDAYYQEDVWHSAAKSAYDFVMHRSRFRVSTCPGGGACLYLRGRLVSPRVFVDETPVSFEALQRINPDQLAAVEVFRGGLMIRLYTTGYFGSYARAGRRLPLFDIIR